MTGTHPLASSLFRSVSRHYEYHYSYVCWTIYTPYVGKMGKTRFDLLSDVPERRYPTKTPSISHSPTKRNEHPLRPPSRALAQPHQSTKQRVVLVVHLLQGSLKAQRVPKTLACLLPSPTLMTTHPHMFMLHRHTTKLSRTCPVKRTAPAMKEAAIEAIGRESHYETVCTTTSNIMTTGEPFQHKHASKKTSTRESRTAASCVLLTF